VDFRDNIFKVCDPLIWLLRMKSLLEYVHGLDHMKCK
jgi:hypothetical protein